MSTGFHDGSLFTSRNADFKKKPSRSSSSSSSLSTSKSKTSSTKTERTSYLRSFLSSSTSPKYQKLQQQNHGTIDHFHRTYVHGHVDTCLGDDDEDDEDNIFELPEIRSRKGPGGSKTSDHSISKLPGSSDVDFLQHTVTDVDTVQSLSIKYSCPVSELKRVNHLIRDQDLFGRKLVKVPIRKYGHITELHKDLLIPESGETTNMTEDDTHKGLVDCTTEMTATPGPLALSGVDEERCDFHDPDMQRRIFQSLSIKDMIHSQTKEAEEFLRSMDKDLEVLRNSTKNSRQSLDEVISVLTSKSIQPLQKSSNMWNFSGDDCGLRFRTILAAVIIIGIVIPLVIIICFKYFKT
ncbi:lysM and putative peptidoglycan-binding domain-containing protein 3-like [Argonauta hians]